MPCAADDAERIYRQIVHIAPVTGQAWYNRLIKALDSLADYPERCEVVNQLSKRGRTVRKLLYGRKPNVYRVYFDIMGTTVRVLHIRHGARREPSLRDLKG
jgi:plasmid stabilization system protein ParE